INLELTLADLQSTENALEKARRQAKSGNPDAQRKVGILERLVAHLQEGNPARSLELDDEDRRRIREYHLLTLKPMLYVANVDDLSLADPEQNPHYRTVAERAAEEGSVVVAISAQLESEMAEMDD